MRFFSFGGYELAHVVLALMKTTPHPKKTTTKNRVFVFNASRFGPANTCIPWVRRWSQLGSNLDRQRDGHGKQSRHNAQGQRREPRRVESRRVHVAVAHAMRPTRSHAKRRQSPCWVRAEWPRSATSLRIASRPHFDKQAPLGFAGGRPPPNPKGPFHSRTIYTPKKCAAQSKFSAPLAYCIIAKGIVRFWSRRLRLGKISIRLSKSPTSISA